MNIGEQESNENNIVNLATDNVIFPRNPILLLNLRMNALAYNR